MSFRTEENSRIGGQTTALIADENPTEFIGYFELQCKTGNKNFLELPGWKTTVEKQLMNISPAALENEAIHGGHPD